MGFDQRVCAAIANLVELRLQKIERAGRFAAGDGINQDGELRAVGKRVCQVEPAYAEIFDANFLRPRAAQELLSHLDAEGVVAEEDVPDAGDQYSRRHCGPRLSSTTSTSSGLTNSR